MCIVTGKQQKGHSSMSCSKTSPCSFFSCKIKTFPVYIYIYIYRYTYMNIQIICHLLIPTPSLFTSSLRLLRRHVHYCKFLIWLFSDFPQQPSRVPINAKRYQIHPTPTWQKRRFLGTYTSLFPECPLFKQRNSYCNWSFFFVVFPWPSKQMTWQ